MSNLIFYSLGVVGMWYVCDGIISIRLYLNSKDETGKRTQSFWNDHIIRVSRSLLGVYIILIGAWGIR